MKYHEFLAKIRQFGEYESQEEAERVTRTVLGVLGARLTGSEAKDLAAQLPDQMSDVLLVQSEPGQPLGVEEFLSEVAKRLGGASTETARWDASAVLTTVAQGIEGGQLNHVLSQLPTHYAPLFGHPELA